MTQSDLDTMARALELARAGEGHVEPNPLVGCVVVQNHEVVGEGWHRQFGGPHAEIEALQAAGPRAAGATAYVTLEPCCHQGKTPPCTDALVKAQVARVVVACADPFPQVDGGGIQQLRDAGIQVDVGVCEAEALDLVAPYRKLVQTSRPWVIAKWAMSFDGKIATATGESQWISGPASRAVVHQIRGRVDAVMVGRRTAEVDDPLLTARPAGPCTATRIVVDSQASLSLESQLVRTAADAPVLVAVSADAPRDRCSRLEEAGCEVFRSAGDTHTARLLSLLDELGRRRMTNVLVEGGSLLLGSFFDAGQVDEIHIFIAPKILGGEGAPAPVAGEGITRLTEASQFGRLTVQQLENDVYLSGRRLQA